MLLAIKHKERFTRLTILPHTKLMKLGVILS